MLDFETVFRQLEPPCQLDPRHGLSSSAAAESWESVPIFYHGLELVSDEKQQSSVTRG